MFDAKLLVAGVSLCVVGCAISEGESTRTRDFGDVTATSQKLESGDLEVTLLDADQVEVASLRWQADSRTTEWEIVDLQQGVIDGAVLTLETADQALFDIWAISHGADVAYDPCDCFDRADGKAWCCYTCTATGTLITCFGRGSEPQIEVTWAPGPCVACGGY